MMIAADKKHSVSGPTFLSRMTLTISLVGSLVLLGCEGERSLTAAGESSASSASIQANGTALDTVSAGTSELSVAEIREAFKVCDLRPKDLAAAKASRHPSAHDSSLIAGGRGVKAISVIAHAGVDGYQGQLSIASANIRRVNGFRGTLVLWNHPFEAPGEIESLSDFEGTVILCNFKVARLDRVRGNVIAVDTKFGEIRDSSGTLGVARTQFNGVQNQFQGKKHFLTGNDVPCQPDASDLGF